jgi:AraC-like DNA-binding protein
MKAESQFWRPRGLDGAEVVFASHGRYAYPRHFHEEYVVALMVRGIERIRAGRHSDLAPSGSIILINPGEVHENAAVDEYGFAYRTLYVPAMVVERYASGAKHQDGTKLEFPKGVVSDKDALGLLRSFHTAVEDGEPNLRLQSLLTMILANLSQRHSAECSEPIALPPPRAAVSVVRDFLDAHFAEDVSLADLSQLVGLSPFHLVRSFREQVGLPPSQYLVHRRVLHAVRQLRKGASIAATAVETGFVDQSHLTRHFKRIVGVTPGRFRADRKIVQDGNRS